MKHAFLTLGALLVASRPELHAAPAKTPLKVFILAGQSNMEGQAVADLEGKDYNDGKGTLAQLMRDPAKAPIFKHLRDERGAWVVRDDVWVRYRREHGPLLRGPLTMGFTVYGDPHHFGPELQFGHVIGDHLENQVLLIKTAWGGKSLSKDFRPPSSGGETGPYYTKMLAEIREALANLRTDFPDYDGGGYELAGFVWYHGWNDGCEPATAVPQYEANLVNLIRDVRKDLNAPNLPVVIGELTGPWVQAPGEWATLRKAQAAAATRPEFKGNVLFVETHDFVRAPEESPNPGHGHHEFGNAETYFLVGDALGKGMKTLLEAWQQSAVRSYRGADYPKSQPSADGEAFSNDRFALRLGPSGIVSLRQPGDRFDTEFLRAGETLGALSIAYRTDEGAWHERSTRGAAGAVSADGAVRRRVTHRFDGELQIDQRFSFRDHALVWTIELCNLAARPLQVGDLGFPLGFATDYVWDKDVTYTKRLIPHFLICGHASFLFLMRTCGEGAFLLVTPSGGTSLEFLDLVEGARKRLYQLFIHSVARGERARANGGTWRQPHTGASLAPAGSAGASATYEFKLQWVDGYDGVRDALAREGSFDVHVVPGMTVPADLCALVALRSQSAIESIAAEHPDQTSIEALGAAAADTRRYRVSFARLGENLLTVRYAGGRRMTLEFFVTEPLETLIKKRAAFLVERQQHRDPARWYDGLVSDWDMRTKTLRSPDDLDGLNPYVVACDDPGLCKVPYVASKNAEFPVPAEIAAIDRYIDRYVWGGLQCTEKEKHPFAIYGIPNWKVNRESADPGRNGREHLWRIYDYPHIVLLYFRRYQIARRYPEIPASLRPEEYLRRAYGTAKAYFTVPLAIERWSAYETGTYNELVIVDLIEALAAEGFAREAEDLRGEWERKVRHFVNDDPYLFGSEYPFDSTGFESTHALAAYAMERAARPGEPLDTDFRRQVRREDAARFLERQLQANLACRGWIETAYYYLGSDYRASHGGGYTLSYMSQMGGWAILDYALSFAIDPARYLRLGYASYLSSWALMNTGTPASNYGYWFPGKENDGAAGGGFEPRAYARSWLGKSGPRGCWQYGCEIDLGFSGALRAAATIVVDDPLFGLFAYGGLLVTRGTAIEVVPRDGLRTRFHHLAGGRRLHMLWERDGFAAGRPIVVDETAREIRFRAECRGGGTHEASLALDGFPATLEVDGPGARIERAGKATRLILSLGPGLEPEVRLRFP